MASQWAPWTIVVMRRRITALLFVPLLLVLGATTPISASSAPLDGTLTVGTVTATRGQLIEVPVTLDVDVPIVGIQLNVAYDGSLLQSGDGKRGPALPKSWQVFSNEPAPGDLRLITLSFEGDTLFPGSEPKLLAVFRVAPDAPTGDIPISVALLHIAGTENNLLDLAIVGGAVKVIDPWTPPSPW